MPEDIEYPVGLSINEALPGIRHSRLILRIVRSVEVWRLRIEIDPFSVRAERTVMRLGTQQATALFKPGASEVRIRFPPI